MRVSRRTVLTFGGSVVALLSGAALWKAQSVGPSPPSGGSRETMERLVDHRGWMLTAADKKKILERQPTAPAAPSSDRGVEAPPPRDADRAADAP
jgi:hypothetical protein